MVNYYIGLDIGGTNIRISVVKDTEIKVLNIIKYPFKKFDTPKQEIDFNICLNIEKIIEKNKLNIKCLKGIGLSLSANFNRESGDIISWPNNQRWNGYPLKKYLKQIYGVPIAMEDDANCAALGEYICGNAKGNKSFAYITISTGIGCGLFLNNELYIGMNGLAGEIGHVVMEHDGPKCTCGMNGCLQSLACGSSLLNKIKENANLYGVNINGYSSLEEILGKMSNEEFIKKSFRQVTSHIADMISFLIIVLDISVIVIGGGIGNLGDILMNPLKEALSSHEELRCRNIKLKNAALGDNSGVIGAMNLIYYEINKRYIDI